MNTVETPETAQMWTILIGLAVMFFGLVVVLLSRGIADRVRALRAVGPRGRAIVQVAGIAIIWVGVAIVAPIILGR